MSDVDPIAAFVARLANEEERLYGRPFAPQADARVRASVVASAARGGWALRWAPGLAAALALGVAVLGLEALSTGRRAAPSSAHLVVDAAFSEDADVIGASAALDASKAAAGPRELP